MSAVSVDARAAVAYDVTYTESRNRLTNAFRIILAIPHLIVVYVWNLFAEVLAVVQWFIVLFTGQRNESIWNLQNQYLGYLGRVQGYVTMLFDQYPAFGTDPGNVPVTQSFDNTSSVNRLSNALRIIWAIPAAIIAALLGIALYVVLIITWFAIVITGKDPRGMFDFVLKVVRYDLQLLSYAFLMTDTYPKFG